MIQMVSVNVLQNKIHYKPL